MRALILAGGEGTRLRPLTTTTPKPVVPLVNRPFLTYMLEWLASHGTSDAVISSGFLADGIREVLGDRACGVDLRYVQEEKPLGTAGAIKFAADTLGDRFLVLNGDVLTDLDLTALIEFHRAKRARATVALTPVEDPTNYGLVRTDSSGAILEFVEKPSPEQIDTNLINAGAYVLERSVLDLIPIGGRVSIERDVFPELVDQGLYALADDSYWIDIGTPERYLQATADILDGKLAIAVAARRSDGEGPRESPDEIGAEVRGMVSMPVALGHGTVVEEGAYVGCHAAIGGHCRVRSGAEVRHAVIHDSCEIGPDVVVRDSVIAAGVRIGAGARIEDGTVVGEGAVIGAGNTLAAEARVAPGEEIPEVAMSGGSGS